MNNKMQKKMLVFSLFILTIIFIIFIYELIDFRNDYICSTTDDMN